MDQLLEKTIVKNQNIALYLRFEQRKQPPSGKRQKSFQATDTMALGKCNVGKWDIPFEDR